MNLFASRPQRPTPKAAQADASRTEVAYDPYDPYEQLEPLDSDPNDVEASKSLAPSLSYRLHTAIGLSGASGFPLTVEALVAGVLLSIAFKFFASFWLLLGICAPPMAYCLMASVREVPRAGAASGLTLITVAVFVFYF
jgi:hypothetical protein